MSNYSDSDLSERKKVMTSMVKQDSFDTEADNFLLSTRRDDGRSPTKIVE